MTRSESLASRTPASPESRASSAPARAAFGERANESARRASAGRYLLHTLTNVPRLAREGDVRALEGLAPGVPAIVAAAGPSLDRNVHELAPVRDRAILIACDTAARPLITGGIDPDLIVSADPSRVNAGHLSSLPDARSWLVAEASVHPSAFVHFDRRSFLFRVSTHEPWPWLAAVGLERGLLGTWGSVATSAFSLALAIGCDPIVFIGADFAFTGGRPYCRGTSFESQWALWTASGATLEDVWRRLVERWPEAHEPDLATGQPVRTAPHLLSFRDWIAGQCATSNRRIVNGTGAGVLQGPGIDQANTMALLWTAPALDFTALHRRLREAHSASRGDLARTLAAVDAQLRTARTSPEREAWAAFAAGAIPAPAIDLALRSPEYVAWTLADACRTAASLTV